MMYISWRIEHDLNDFHSTACGIHLSRLATTQKTIHYGYFWPSLFKYCIHTINKRCEKCQIFSCKRRVLCMPLHLVITTSPFSKWGIKFMECFLASSQGKKYIVVVINYFTKWEELMPTFNYIDTSTTHFFFNNVISQFGVHKQLVSDNRTHFGNETIEEL